MTAPHEIVLELARRRQELGLTHDDIHASTGIARSSVRNWETGRRAPMLSALDAYLRAMGFRLTVVPLEQPVDVVVGEQLPFGELVLCKTEKFCSGCQQVRSRERDFHSDRSRGDGLSPYCRYCVSEQRQARKQRAQQAGLGRGRREAAA
jgi:transcriptional regulator with XRE-family HTH domain